MREKYVFKISNIKRDVFTFLMLEDKIKTVDQKLTKIISGGSRKILTFRLFVIKGEMWSMCGGGGGSKGTKTKHLFNVNH